MIKAIETEYNGYKFRSRLEARWAVFFDALKIDYQYGPERFVGVNDTPYLPDFYLPKEHIYVEVKGSDEALRSDWEKISAAIDFEATPCSNGLMILGDIPDIKEIDWGNVPMFSYLYWRKGIACEYAIFYPSLFSSVICGNKEILRSVFDYESDYSEYEQAMPENLSTKNSWTRDGLRSRSQWDYLKQAFLKARQARFEYGEKPII